LGFAEFGGAGLGGWFGGLVVGLLLWWLALVVGWRQLVCWWLVPGVWLSAVCGSYFAAAGWLSAVWLSAVWLSAVCRQLHD